MTGIFQAPLINILRISYLVIFCTLFSLAPAMVSGQHGAASVRAEDSLSAKTNHERKSESFNAGEMILEHVVDNHDWHILTIGHFELKIALPVILYFDGKLYIFWSSEFNNAERSHKGFTLAGEGPD